MAQKSIDQLIICNPYVSPTHHWSYDHTQLGFEKKDGRRRAGYMVGSSNASGQGEYRELPLAQNIRERVDAWRNAGFPGVTKVTRDLLDYWTQRTFGDNELRPFFFCQLEAVETLIWLTEAPPAERVGIDIPTDGGDFVRWCTKMATGTGKTVVMSMLITWNILNKLKFKQDTRFSKNVLIVAPNLTVKSRLQVLDPSNPENFYNQFNIVPPHYANELRQGKVRIINWHMLQWDNQETLDKNKHKIKSVDKRKRIEISDRVYAKMVLDEMSKAENFIVINDEAHHAWRVPAISKTKGLKKDQIEATVWVSGLDRLNKSNGILRCFDLSATPFAPSGGKSGEDALFEWIVSDFNLYDAIESGLVKTPRVVVKSDDKAISDEMRSKLFHLYNEPEIKDNLQQKNEDTPLPSLLLNAYMLLGEDWLKTYEEWMRDGSQIPPVMITVANTTYSAMRIKNAFLRKDISIDELADEKYLVEIDAKMMEEAEDTGGTGSGDEGDDSGRLSNKRKAEIIREKVNTTGKVGKPGQDLRNIVSVAMLSEGWDANNVTQIMGLRAFSSQLLCEQVVGRGLRRASYDIDPTTMLLKPEYVNVFGIPFSFLPFEGDGTSTASTGPTKPSVLIQPDDKKIDHRIDFPDINTIQAVIKPQLVLDWHKVQPLTLNSSVVITKADLEGIIEGKPSLKAYSEIELQKMIERNRVQTIIFKVVAQLKSTLMGKAWKGSDYKYIGQLVELVEEFIQSDKLIVQDQDFAQGTDKWKVLIMLQMGTIIQHLGHHLSIINADRYELIFNNPHKQCRSTSDLQTWYTTKKFVNLEKTHINLVVVDSQLEAIEAQIINDSPLVKSFVKNDHLHFAIWYLWEGIPRRYYPDFIIEMNNGKKMVLETKGKDDEQNRVKRQALERWVNAVNQSGAFGTWCWDVSFHQDDLSDKLKQYGV
jgi:type III restriction enzyme